MVTTAKLIVTMALITSLGATAPVFADNTGNESATKPTAHTDTKVRAYEKDDAEKSKAENKKSHEKTEIKDKSKDRSETKKEKDCDDKSQKTAKTNEQKNETKTKSAEVVKNDVKKNEHASSQKEDKNKSACNPSDYRSANLKHRDDDDDCTKSGAGKTDEPKAKTDQPKGNVVVASVSTNGNGSVAAEKANTLAVQPAAKTQTSPVVALPTTGGLSFLAVAAGVLASAAAYAAVLRRQG